MRGSNLQFDRNHRSQRVLQISVQLGSYQLLAAAAEKAPSLFQNDLSMVQRLFAALAQEAGAVKPAVQQVPLSLLLLI